MDCFDDTTASIEKAFLNIRFLGSSTIINFIWTPVLAWGWGYFLIRSSSFMDWFYYAYGDTLHGLVPRIYRHSKRECVSFNIDSTDHLILQVVLLPIYLLLFAGSIETIPLPTLIESILIVLIFPFVLAHLTRFLLRRKEPVLSNIVIPFFSNAQIFFLSFAIMAMFASQGSYLLDHLEVIYILIIPILIFLLSTMC